MSGRQAGGERKRQVEAGRGIVTRELLKGRKGGESGEDEDLEMATEWILGLSSGSWKVRLLRSITPYNVVVPAPPRPRRRSGRLRKQRLPEAFESGKTAGICDGVHEQ